MFLLPASVWGTRVLGGSGERSGPDGRAAALTLAQGSRTPDFARVELQTKVTFSIVYHVPAERGET